jgi:hypothetical protein
LNASLQMEHPESGHVPGRRPSHFVSSFLTSNRKTKNLQQRCIS